MTGTATELLAERTLGTLLRRYEGVGTPLACHPVPQGLLNRGYRLATTRGRFFLKHYVAPDTADAAVIARQHRATLLLDGLGLPVAAPVADTEGRTVAVVGGRCYALYPWVEGRHREGTELTAAQSRRLGALLGHVHAGLARVQPPPEADRVPHPSADPGRTYALIDELLDLAHAHEPRETFDELAEHRLLERRTLLERHAHRRPPAPDGPATGWVHGDFHPLNLLYRGDEPVAIVDWDRLGVQPRAEEAVRAAAIFFVRPGDGKLDLAKVRPYARAYRLAAGVTAQELAAAVHRVWWERLNDFWMLRWRYQERDRRSDPLFPASSALAVWWTREYEAVSDAFTG
ncbi:phosphotransferase [Streptomyces sp. RKAG293]|uniref:phosphotransferase n=1 Tax=Streptomyces sp. RKAG293 TaxID=2893403 RepID=UPI0020340897|nr:phosphotransferase [Streptomyces sp. RKAG293]MCM2420500.1 phosphotransferase [Streptomyces sp. RKAG293]